MVDLAVVFGGLFTLICAVSYLILDRMGRKAKTYVDNLPSVSPLYPNLTLIKPVFGADEHTETAFRSWLDQAYPEQVQFIFSLQDQDDPALRILEKLRSQYEFEITVNPIRNGFSGKMSNLVQGLERAKHETLIFSDADLVGPPNTLKKLGAIAQQGVDIACCFPLHIEAENAWADIFSLTWNQILIQIVAPSIIRKDPHGLAGGTILVNRSTLNKLGGLERFRNIIAEDFAMGRAARDEGLTVGLGPEVHSPTGTMSFSELYGKLKRSHLVGLTMNPQGLPSIFIWYLVNYGYLFLFLGGAFSIFSATVLLAMRAIYLGSLNKVAEGRFRVPPSFLIGDIITIGSFFLSWFDRTVRWGGQSYRVIKGGKMLVIKGKDSAE